MRFTLSLTFLFITNILLAQSIRGRLTDTTGKAVELAAITLHKLPDSSIAYNSMGDVDGNYEFLNVKPGKYFITAFQMGFKKKRTTTIEIESQDILFPIEMREETSALEEVVISAQKPMVVQEPGKITVNVESMAASVGLMAIDLLKRMPGVQVDNDGNISLKGKSQVLIMIDGKPSYLSAKQIGIILKSLPSNQISNIEIITSPSAKYDARGNAGIININLKKTDKKGVNGTLQTTLGHGILYKSNTGGSLSIGFKKWQLNAIYDFTANRNLEVFIQDRNFGGINSGYRYLVSQHYEVPTETHNYRLSADFNPSKKISFSINQRGMFIKDRWISTNTGDVVNKKGEIIQHVLSHDYNPNYNNDLGVGGGGKYKIDSSGQELSIDMEVSRYQQRSWQNIATYVWNHDTLSTLDFHAYLPMDYIVAFGKLDYTKPIGKALKLETGYKITGISIDNSLQYFLSQTGNFLAQIPKDNHFNYLEQINAGYLSLKWDSTNWSVQLGVRAEHWRANGKLINASFQRDSLQYFPNFMTKYKVHSKHELSFAMSRRIDRPNYMNLNPIAYYGDPYSYYQGNPRLLPQSTYHYELAHNYLNGLITTTVNYSRTSNFILDYATFQTSDTGKIQFMGPANIPLFENYGISSSFSMPVTKFWTTQLYANLYRNHFAGYSNRYNVDFDLIAYSANTTQQFLFPNAWTLELTGNYSSPTIWGYNRNRSMGMLSIAVKKEFAEGKWVAKVNFQDIFYTFQYKGDNLIPETNSRWSYRWDNRLVNFSLVYKFGKKQA